jgi:hypothetical protein
MLVEMVQLLLSVVLWILLLLDDRFLKMLVDVHLRFPLEKSQLDERNKILQLTRRLREARSCFSAILACKSGSTAGASLSAARNLGTFFNGANRPGFGAAIISNVSP